MRLALISLHAPTAGAATDTPEAGAVSGSPPPRVPQQPNSLVRLRDSLASFVAAGRKSGGSAAAGRGAPKMTASSGRRPQPLDREQTAAIRAWARQNGWSSC